jgi:IclR family transcriptional regulator, pca regulon regulatory protein
MDATTEASRTNLVGGFIKGLTVIEAFDVDRPRQSIADISRTTGYDRATCRRLLLTLVHAGYAEHDGKYFWLSPRTVRLGNAYLHSATLPNIIQPYLETLAEDIHESCSASILDGDEVLYIARASHQRVMSINLRIGSRLPLYCSSMGRVLLAGFDDDEVRRILERTPLLRHTPSTIVDIDELIELVRAVRRDGYAIVDQELEAGLRSIAVPALDKRGNAIAALNIGTHAARVPAERLTNDYLPQLNALQAELREIL